MSQSPQQKLPTRGIAELLDSLVASEGTGAHPHVRSGRLSQGGDAMRNLADAVHFLCLLHGRHPGVVDSAARKAVDPASRAWMEEAAQAFADERAFLSQVAAAAGPVPSTPGQDQCEAAVAAQCKALDMLAESDRHGCAVGAAIALALDWRTIRVLLDISAQRLDLSPPGCALPDLPGTARLAGAIAQTPAIERALTFGAQQLLAQHSGLWDLLAARAAARTHS
ncbi:MULTISPECIES: DUF6975 family protein [Sphingopyxis]|uniref:DUF6975 family protein n=1 Tax=Sphingopyxis TaxID=165697 RepID=UPI0009EF1FDF|nr:MULTISPECIES: hypothetical protein [Sphingopyxis]AVA14320.1 hypothetical protein C3E99_11110 [Sphingopyxis sp. MG]QUM73797.1 hypothetical protein ICN83_08035 [Sphingopyxis granuli]